MNARIFWKLFVSALVFAWSVYYLVPLRDTPLPDYLLAHVTGDKEQFQKILTEAQKDAVTVAVGTTVAVALVVSTRTHANWVE